VPRQSTKVAALEEKLDNIVQLLQSPQSQQAPRGSSSTSTVISLIHDSIQRDTFGSNSLETPAESSCHSQSEWTARTIREAAEVQVPFTPASSPPTADLSIGCHQLSRASLLLSDNYPQETEDELAEYLETYRSKMVPFFPIVPIKPDVTVRSLAEDWPFLWLVIRSVCNKNSARQRALGQKVRATLAVQMLLEGTKSLDLLLGILVFASWGHFYIFKRPQLSTDIHLATSLAADLGLLKPLPQQPVGVMLNFGPSGCPRPPNHLPIGPRTMKERRAAVGLFLLSSMLVTPL
jgi:hypothetical protein